MIISRSGMLHVLLYVQCLKEETEMQKKLTLTIDEEVYEGLRTVIGARKISWFIEA